MTRVRRLRPEQGGKMMGPVGPTERLPEDTRPVCTECRQRIEPGETRTRQEERPTFFRHVTCPSRCEEPAKVCRWCGGSDLAVNIDLMAYDCRTCKACMPRHVIDGQGEELERERKRLVGKRATDFGGWTVERVELGGLYPPLTACGTTDDGGMVQMSVDAVTLEEKPRETTFDELAVGEWFKSPRGHIYQKSGPERVKTPGCPYADWWIGGDDDATVTRIDPPENDGHG